MNISEFRKDLKNQFDKALKGPVLIERGGVAFELKATGVIGKVITMEGHNPERDQFVPANLSNIPGVVPASKIKPPTTTYKNTNSWGA